MPSLFTHWNRKSVYESIRELSYAFQKSRVLFTACELDLFSVIGYEFMSAEHIAHRIDADEKATERLLNSLAGLQLLIKKEQAFGNSPESLRYLARGSHEFMGDMNHHSDVWDSWSKLTDCIKTGRPVKSSPVNEKSSKWINDYISSSHWRANIEASEIIKMLNFKHFKKFLDLGAGSGQYAIEVAKNYPNMEIVIYDYPEIIQIAKKNIFRHGMTSRIEVLEGDFIKDDWGSDYDIILLSNVVHMYSIWENVTTLQRCYDSMVESGLLIINEAIISDTRTSPLTSALFSLNLLLNTKSGDSYSETDVWIMMREAWFKDIEMIYTQFETTLMIGTR